MLAKGEAVNFCAVDRWAKEADAVRCEPILYMQKCRHEAADHLA